MRLRILAPLALAALAIGGGAKAATPERVQITGEVIDTWCYFSGVMGGPDSTLGSAHHTCALWCSAGQLFQRDGVNYLVVEDVVTNEGIVNLSHEDYGVIPPFSFPDPNKKKK